ncbi:MAG: uroporphyrinogen-III synthase [Pseudomonadota bacterium]|uniref:uroporphyrinogen-III synthase n=1 Tax=Sphingomonas sp. ERG5 TaxID=1381597 RepID=UPI00054C32BF|nr:uroporphyrinogen-III synthase [Sphingomonas sp. ERG5]
MTRPLAVLRPEPGNAATAARAEALGFDIIRLPLFKVRPVDWTVPDLAAHDALILTSANAVRHAGAGLVALRALPVLAVGEKTAQAAREMGLDVMATGTGDMAALLALAETHGVRKAVHLGGRDRVSVFGPAIHSTIIVYQSDVVAVPPHILGMLAGSVALLHSARAASRLAELIDGRAVIRIAALSGAILAAAGSGWAGHAVAVRPDDAALLDAARLLAD